MENESKLPSFLIDSLNQQYGKSITQKICKGYSTERKTTLRINTIKAKPSTILNQLEKLKIEYEKVSWSPEAIVLKNIQEKQIQDLPMYQNGEIYLQSLSSMLPPLILAPKPNTDILDMAAAPGSKTTQIAAITQNKAHITACEINAIRAKRLQYNLEKQGASSVYLMISDARKLDDFLKFDTILLDTPCSGSGTIRTKDRNFTSKFTPEWIEKCRKSQMALLRKAIKLLKPGQELVYSTCSILACENEEIIAPILKETNMQIVPIHFSGLEDLPILPTPIKGTLCLYPNEYWEGFFVAKLRKDQT